eukprot:TRINITY_DN6532_c1_g3_i1.p1 TRINITY_DN6532_c1_g3~~TRINITY_DN6532_c1_g3_i1.p1  ORF type:complete len:695 (+),score=224.98 TRINITY_DN6532_c1_g3_i1:118-2085(+)
MDTLQNFLRHNEHIGQGGMRWQAPVHADHNEGSAPGTPVYDATILRGSNGAGNPPPISMPGPAAQPPPRAAEVWVPRDRQDMYREMLSPSSAGSHVSPLDMASAPPQAASSPSYPPQRPTLLHVADKHSQLPPSTAAAAMRLQQSPASHPHPSAPSPIHMHASPASTASPIAAPSPMPCVSPQVLPAAHPAAVGPRSVRHPRIPPGVFTDCDWVTYRSPMFPESGPQLGRCDAKDVSAPNGSVSIRTMGDYWLHKPAAAVSRAVLIVVDVAVVLRGRWAAQRDPAVGRQLEDVLNLLFEEFVVGVYCPMPDSSTDTTDVLRAALGEKRHGRIVFSSGSLEPDPGTLFDEDEEGTMRADRGWKDHSTLFVDGGSGYPQHCHGNVLYLPPHHPADGLEGFRRVLELMRTNCPDVTWLLAARYPAEWRKPWPQEIDSFNQSQVAEELVSRQPRKPAPASSPSFIVPAELSTAAIEAALAEVGELSRSGRSPSRRRAGRALTVADSRRGFDVGRAAAEVLEKLEKEFGIGVPGRSREWWPQIDPGSRAPPPPRWAMRPSSSRDGRDGTRDDRSRTPPKSRGSASPSPGRRTPPRRSGVPPAAELRRMPLDELKRLAQQHDVPALATADEYVSALLSVQRAAAGSPGSPGGRRRSPRRTQ